MTREESKVRALVDLGEVAVPERAGADIEASAVRFASSLQRLKARRRSTPVRRALFWALAGCLAAAVAVYVVGRGRGVEEAAQPSVSSSPLQVELATLDGEATRTLDAEGREWFVTEANGALAVRMVSDARVLLGPSSEAWSWSEPGPSWLHLEVGQVDVSVPRLRMGQSLTVHTPNASIVVHGTAFTVQVIGTEPPVTTVAVREGTVEVREGDSATFVHAGEVWRSGGMKATALPSTSPSAATFAPRESEQAVPQAALSEPTSRREMPLAQTASAAASAPSGANESSLARENALFREANKARQRGDFESSQATLAKLLAEFPQSPMRATALVERAFALSRLGRSSDASVVAKQALSEGASDHVREQLWVIAFGEKPPVAKPSPE